jgi:hypothetical protein
MSESEKHSEHIYTMKGIPVNAYLSETGEFRWIPAPPACSDKTKAKEIIEVLKKMPDDRRTVWASRLDTDQIATTCPIIRTETDLCKEFDQFCAAYSKPKLETPDKKNAHAGGDFPNE